MAEGAKLDAVIQGTNGEDLDNPSRGAAAPRNGPRSTAMGVSESPEMPSNGSWAKLKEGTTSKKLAVPIKFCKRALACMPLKPR